METYRIAAEMKDGAEMEKVQVLQKLVRHADGSADFQSIREGMAEPKDPLLLSKECVVYRVPQVLWMPVCLNSSGVSSVPGTSVVPPLYLRCLLWCYLSVGAVCPCYLYMTDLLLSCFCVFLDFLIS